MPLSRGYTTSYALELICADRRRIDLLALDLGFEVDFILNDEIAIEVKSKKIIAERDLRSLRAIAEEAQCDDTLWCVWNRFHEPLMELRFFAGVIFFSNFGPENFAIKRKQLN